MVFPKENFDSLTQLAIQGKHEELLSRIRANSNLAKGCDRHGSTLLIEVLPYANNETIKELISQGSNMTIVNDEGFSCLHKIIEERNPDHKELLELLIQSGADPNVHGWNGWTPLHQAVSYGLPVHVVTLLENGADLKVRTGIDDDETPMMIAKRKHDKNIQELLRRYA